MNEREIFLKALELSDPAAREMWLKVACGSDAALLAGVRALLKAHSESGQFLETPIAGNDELARAAEADGQGTEGEQSTCTSSATIGVKLSTDGNCDIEERPTGSVDRWEAEFRRFLVPSGRPGSMGRLGHYEIECILGGGAFGTVAKAFDEKLQRTVAIKMLKADLASTSPPRKRFLREARTAAAVSHGNLVAIHAVEEAPVPYIVMEYVPGRTLQYRMDSEGPFNAATILRIGKATAQARISAFERMPDRDEVLSRVRQALSKMPA